MEQAHLPPVTYRDLRRYPDDGKRRELIDGEVIVSPSPAVDHQTVVIRLAVALPLRKPVDYAIRPASRVLPDLVVDHEALFAPAFPP
jgi:hypothetical protein